MFKYHKKIQIIEPLGEKNSHEKQSPIVLANSYLIRIAWVSGHNNLLNCMFKFYLIIILIFH